MIGQKLKYFEILFLEYFYFALLQEMEHRSFGKVSRIAIIKGF